MNPTNSIKENILPKFICTILIILTGIFHINAQIKVPFTQRTSQYSPTKKVYNLKGDFALMGNTNLTLQNYDDNQPNNNNFMRYVDVDGDSNTWNSSSSTLQLSTENGANPNCSKIIYAGLYWTGRAAIDDASSTDIFQVSKSVDVTQTINNNQIVAHEQVVTNTNYILNISRNNDSSLKNPIYTFVGNGNTYVFEFTNNIGTNALTLSINGAVATNIFANLTTLGTNTLATFLTPYIIVDGNLNIQINSLVRDSSTSLGTSQTLATSFANINTSGTIIQTNTVSKTFDKRKISLKGPNSSVYTEFTANPDEIYYPNTSDYYIYSGYKEITDYVNANGIGEYLAADIALKEGNGGGSGYYGGWGMIVIYENQVMKQRNVTVFDGYAFVTGTGNYDIPITGINAVQTGPVGMKLGLMAAEGDRPYSGDYFQIQKQVDGSYMNLKHSGNETNNFFNSSIVTGGNPRNPSLLNNTSMDLSMFEIPNLNNEVITNNQTSVNFKYGTTFETVVIYAMAFSVDTYVPDVDVIIAATNINGNPILGTNITTMPNDIVDMKMQIRNSGNEPVNNTRFVVPIPYTATYVEGSLAKNVYFTPLPSPNNCYFDPTLGINGSIVWDFGTLPLPASPDVLLADYTFKIKITNDCSILKNEACGQNAAISGITSGVGAITGTIFSDKDYFIGYNNDGSCVGLPILDPLPISIDATNFVQINCQNTSDIREFTFCNIANTTIQITDVAGAFPVGTLFYNQFPITSSTIQYTITNPFPGKVGANTYIAVPPSTNLGCFYQFKINISNAPSIPTVVNVSYCQDTNALPLIATLNNSTNTLFFYTSLTSGAQLTLTPATNIAGQFIYYVAEASSGTCISDKVAIVVTINPIPIATTPDLINIIGCTTAAITDLVYSETDVNITLAQFLAYGGTYSNFNVDPIISYIDKKTGVCELQVTRIFTIKSPCKNELLTQTIQIKDNINPIPDLVVSGCNTTFPNPNISLVASIYNCSTPIVSFVSDSIPNIVGCVETIIRKYSVTDVCGNSIFVNQNLIRTVDVINPQLISSLELNLNVNCTSIPPKPILNFTDNCSTDLNVVFLENATQPFNGQYTITRSWIVNDNCSNSLTTTQTINVTIQENFGSKNLELCNLNSDIINIDDLLPTGFVGLGSWFDTDNSGGVKSNNQFSPLKLIVGNYNLTYQINDLTCPKKFVIKMKITTNCEVLGVSDCVVKVMTAVSPNNDGNNDTFLIENLDCYPDNKVEIFNRWGVLVFEGEKYNNKSIVFEGISNGRAVVDKNVILPAGTYFYVLNYKENDGKNIDKSGYLYLNK